MLTVNDITGFFLDNASEIQNSTNKNIKGKPIIESWVGLDKKGRVTIKGRIYNHPKHPQGVKINTSSIKSYFSKQGRVYVETKHSIYELGTPINEVELVVKVPEIDALEQVTIWN